MALPPTPARRRRIAWRYLDSEQEESSRYRSRHSGCLRRTLSSARRPRRRPDRSADAWGGGVVRQRRMIQPGIAGTHARPRHIQGNPEISDGPSRSVLDPLVLFAAAQPVADPLWARRNARENQAAGTGSQIADLSLLRRAAAVGRGGRGRGLGGGGGTFV